MQECNNLWAGYHYFISMWLKSLKCTSIKRTLNKSKTDNREIYYREHNEYAFDADEDKYLMSPMVH